MPRKKEERNMPDIMAYYLAQKRYIALLTKGAQLGAASYFRRACAVDLRGTGFSLPVGAAHVI